MLTISGICPRRSTPPERGRRVVLPWRRQMISSYAAHPLAGHRSRCGWPPRRSSRDRRRHLAGWVCSCCAACRQSARETNAHAAYAPPTRSAHHPATAFASVDTPDGGLHLLLGRAGRVAATDISIAAQLPADSRRGSGDQASNLAQAEPLGTADLNGGAFFNAEFGIRHRGSTVPERSGVALSFCRRPRRTVFSYDTPCG